MKSIIGRKIGMTEVFAKDGQMYPVTVVEVLPNYVLQVKTKEKDGYEALQVGIEDKKESRTNSPLRGHFKKANVTPKQVVKELTGDELTNYKVGDVVKADIFKAGEKIDAIGTSKGKGYSGTIKRYGHKIGPKGHGSGYHRGQGSFANNGRCNNRVLPGKKMSGHHGHKSATILNLTVVEVNADKNYILVKGAIPGPRKGIVMLRSAIKTLKKPVVDIKELVDYTPKAKVNEEPKPEVNEAVPNEPVVNEEVVNDVTINAEATNEAPANEVTEETKGE